MDYLKKNKTQQEASKEIRSYAKESESFLAAQKETVYTGGLNDESLMQRDVISLGSKKTWKPDDAQIKRNALIDETRKKTKIEKATADTISVHEQIASVDTTLTKLGNESLFQTLKCTRFDKRMLQSSNIRAHFSEYLSIVKAYDKLKEVVSEKEDARISSLLGRIGDDCELLKKRLAVFSEKNRVKLDGSYMKDKEIASNFHMSRTNLLEDDIFKNTHLDDEKAYEYVAPQKEKVDLALVENELKSKELTQDQKDEKAVYFVEFGKQLVDFSPENRVNNINLMRFMIYRTEKMLTDPQMADNTELKRARLEMRATLQLAECEARILLAEGNEHVTKEMLKELNDQREGAWADYTCIMKRHAKELLPLTSSGSKAGLMDRAQAIDNESDRLNFEFKKKIYDCAAGLPDEKLKAAALAYAKETHYTVGCEKEAALLADVKKELERVLKDQALKDDKSVTELRERLDKLDGGGDTFFPSFGENADKELDPLKYDFSGKTPEESGGKLTAKGRFRNFLMNNALVRGWKNEKDTPIFPHEPTINDLRQGKVSNCYMLAATTSLINYDPSLIKKCIRDNKDGTATVRLYDPKGNPVFIRVDKKVPHLLGGGAILTSGPLWMQLIEQAAAHMGMFKGGESGYHTLWYSSGDKWFRMLTGCNGLANLPDHRKLDEEGKQALFDDIATAKEQHKVFHMGTKEDAGTGLNGGHAYTVLGAKEIDGKKYVTLRNPYANMSYQKDEFGAVNKSSSYFSSVADDTCGQFDIPYEEFLKYAGGIECTVDLDKDMFAGTSKEDLLKAAAAVAAEKEKKPLSKEEEKKRAEELAAAMNDDEDDFGFIEKESEAKVDTYMQ